MQEPANKQKRITLKTVHQMLDGMSVELAEKVHLLFMAFFRFPPSPLSQLLFIHISVMLPMLPQGRKICKEWDYILENYNIIATFAHVKKKPFRVLGMIPESKNA